MHDICTIFFEYFAKILSNFSLVLLGQRSQLISEVLSNDLIECGLLKVALQDIWQNLILHSRALESTGAGAPENVDKCVYLITLGKIITDDTFNPTV